MIPDAAKDGRGVQPSSVQPLLFFHFKPLGYRCSGTSILSACHLLFSIFFPFSSPLPFSMIDHCEDRNLEDEGRKQASLGFSAAHLDKGRREAET